MQQKIIQNNYNVLKLLKNDILMLIVTLRTETRVEICCSNSQHAEYYVLAAKYYNKFSFNQHMQKCPCLIHYFSPI